MLIIKITDDEKQEMIKQNTAVLLEVSNGAGTSDKLYITYETLLKCEEGYTTYVRYHRNFEHERIDLTVIGKETRETEVVLSLKIEKEYGNQFLTEAVCVSEIKTVHIPLKMDIEDN